MAKSKSFFGLRTGSTKSLTFQVLRGQQITKDRVTRVSNPRTTAQMEQRAKLPIVAAARSALKGLVDHSWEGVTYGDPSLRTFSSKNLRFGSIQVTSFASPDVPSPGIADFIVSSGSLEGFATKESDRKAVFSRAAAFGDAKVFPKMTKGTKGSTVIFYLMKYIKDNNLGTLDAGEQLTFLLLNIKSYQDIKIPGQEAPVSVPLTGFEICRLIMPDVTNLTADNIAAYGDDNDFFTLLDEVPEGGLNEVTLAHGDDFVLTISAKAAQLEFSCINNLVTTAGAALIDSKLVDNIWKRSTSRVHVVGSILDERILTFTSWAALYAPAGAKSNKYLNTGNEKTGINS